MGARPAHQLRRGEAKNVAARLLDVNHLSAELCELGANVGLGDQLPGADRTNALQRTERGRDARRCRSLKLLAPLRDSASKLLNLVLVLHEPWIVRHATPLCCGHHAIENSGSNQDHSRAARDVRNGSNSEVSTYSHRVRFDPISR